MDSITKYIYTQVANKALSRGEAKAMLLELKTLRENSADDDQIAVIGMACQFPQSRNLEEYWENISHGKSCISGLPESRRGDTEAYFKRFHYSQLTRDKLIRDDGSLAIDYEVRGYLDEVDKFDADFFNILPREARAMDPKQRQLLQLTNDALENAGMCKDNIRGTGTGVFIGLDHVCEIKYKMIAKEDPLVVTGTWPGILASRISFIYDLKGPCLITDTACSSGLVSVHLACKALKNKECQLAIAGGLSSVFYKPYKFSDESKDLDSIESADNTVYTFDRKANGTVWGEGAGIVILKPLGKALADGDVIHGIIRGHAINNDGASNGITAPDASAQESLFLDVWKNAGIDPGTIRYIEAHGTGTILGDPIEIKALTNAFRKHTSQRQFCGIGSVKTNLGHTVGASGLAALLKVLLMIKHRRIVPSLNFSEPNPYINFTDSPLYVTDRGASWESDEAPRRGAVNAFGFAGTNCHVVVEEAPAGNRADFPAEARSLHFFTLSAKNPESLQRMIKDYLSFLKEPGDYLLDDFCYTSNIGRGHYGYRLILVVSSIEDLRGKLESCSGVGIEKMESEGIFSGFHKIVSESKENRTESELTETERRQLNLETAGMLREFLAEAGSEEIEKIGRAYVRGAAFPWNTLYREKRRRVNLPAYPFERKRYWFESKESVSEKTVGMAPKEIAHPLVDRCLVESIDRDIYTTTFSADTHWIISEHVIVKQNVIPGISYIELIREIARRYFGEAPVIINNMYFLIPVILKPGEIREVQTTVIKQEDESFTFYCASRNEDDLWTKHVEGQVRLCPDSVPGSLDRKALSEKLSAEPPVIDINKKGYKKVIELGPRWQCEEVAQVGESEILIDLNLPREFRDDLKQYALHPALLDNAINAVSQRIAEGLYLPFMYKEIRIFGNLPADFHSLVRLRDTDQLKRTAQPEVIPFDVTMFAPSGDVLIEIRDYKIKKVDVEKSSFKKSRESVNDAFTMQWVKSRPLTGEPSFGKDRFLVLQNDSTCCRKIIRALRKKCSGVTTVGLTPGSGDADITCTHAAGDYLALAKEIQSGQINKILHVCTLQDTLKPAASAAELAAELEGGLYSLFRLVKALLSVRLNSPVQLYVLFQASTEVDGQEPCLLPQHAAIPPFCKVVLDECPHIRVKCIDSLNTDTEVVLKEFATSGDPALFMAYRNNERFIREFRRTPIRGEGEVRISADGLYLITGGTGGLGLAAGVFLAGKGAGHICLLGRKELPPREEWDRYLQEEPDSKTARALKGMREMEAKGARVIYRRADVTDHAAMETLLQNLRKEHKRICGVLHCAGLGGRGVLLNKEEPVFRGVIEPKIQGAWIVDALTRVDQPDFMVLFSSILSLFPEAGQSDYASANAFMDAFAGFREKAGLRTVAISWPAWSETGMALDFQVDFKNSLFQPLSNSSALFYLEEILKSPQNHVLPGKINYMKMAKVYEEGYFRLSGKLAALVAKKKVRESENAGIQSGQEIVIKGKKNDDYNDVENNLAGIWSAILGIKEIDVYDTLTNLGGDSLIAIEMHKMIDRTYPGIIDIADIFSYPSVNQLAEYIRTNLPGGEENKPAGGTARLVTVDDELKDMLDNLEAGDSSIENALEKIDKLL